MTSAASCHGPVVPVRDLAQYTRAIGDQVCSPPDSLRSMAEHTVSANLHTLGEAAFLDRGRKGAVRKAFSLLRDGGVGVLPQHLVRCKFAQSWLCAAILAAFPRGLPHIPLFSNNLRRRRRGSVVLMLVRQCLSVCIPLLGQTS